MADENEIHLFRLVVFLPEKNEIDLVPKTWLSFDLESDCLVCKYPPGDQKTKKNIKQFKSWVSSCCSPFKSWPTYPVEIRGRAKTFAEGESKLEKLETEQYVYTEGHDGMKLSKHEENEYKSQARKNSTKRPSSYTSNHPSDSKSSGDDSDSSIAYGEPPKKPKLGTEKYCKKSLKKKTQRTHNITTKLKNKSQSKLDLNISDEDIFVSPVDSSYDLVKTNSSGRRIKNVNPSFLNSSDDEEDIEMTNIDLTKESNETISFATQNEDENFQSQFDSGIKSKDAEIPSNCVERIIPSTSRITKTQMKKTKQLSSLDQSINDEVSVLTTTKKMYFALKMELQILKDQIVKLQTSVADLRSSFDNTNIVDDQQNDVGNDVLFPLETMEKFLDFELKLSTNENYKGHIARFILRNIDENTSMTKSMGKLLRIALSKACAGQFVAMKETKNKKVFSHTAFYKVIENVFTRKFQKGGNIVTNIMIKESLSGVFNNVKDWDGGRRQRINHQVDNV